MTRLLFLLLVALCAMAPAAGAHSYRLGAVRIGHLWAKQEGPRRFAVYGPLLNSGGAPDALVRVIASAPGARAALVAAKVGPAVRAIALPIGRPVSLASWSVHIEIAGVAARRGTMIPLVLTFAHAGSIRVGAMVENSPSD